MTTFYVSGKMRGIPRYNFPLFDSLSAWLRQQGDEAINPADHDRAVEPDIEQHEHFLLGDPGRKRDGETYEFRDLIGWDLRMIASPECDAIVMLPGWENSEGARHERYVAEACQKPVWLANRNLDNGEWYITLDSDQRRLAGERFGPSAVPLHHRDSHPVYAAMRIEGEDIERLESMSQVWDANPGFGEAATELLNPTVVGLVGYAQVGKDTLASILVQEHGFTRIAFADKLREFLYALNPWVLEDNSHLQHAVNKYGWDYCKTMMPTVRAMLQRLGTEAGREILGPDIWVDAALRAVKPGGKYVITDVRFPNEFAAVERYGGTTVRIIRPDHGPVNGHWSETALDAYPTDVTIWNEGTVEELGAKAAVSLKLVKPVAS